MKRWQLSTQEELKKYVPDIEGETEKLKRDREILKSFIVRHHPEMEGWIKKNFRKGKQR